jgi:hypothetical protein
MKLSKKLIAVPAIALAAGLGLAACSASAPAPVPTHTVTASPAPTTPAPTTPAPTTSAPKVVVVTPAPAQTVYVPAPAPAAPAQSSGNCGGGVSAGPNTSCAFALNVAAAYSGTDGSSAYVYSPVTGQSYTMTYNQSGYVVYATGGNDASVTFTVNYNGG